MAGIINLMGRVEQMLGLEEKDRVSFETTISKNLLKV
jgi:hypothetical protein